MYRQGKQTEPNLVVDLHSWLCSRHVRNMYFLLSKLTFFWGFSFIRYFFYLALLFLARVSCEFFEPEATSSYTTCEQSFANDKFSIVLPKRVSPEPYECKFHISTFSPDVCRLRLNFKKFLLASSLSCRDEFIKIGYRRLCGSIYGTQEVSFTDTSTLLRYRFVKNKITQKNHQIFLRGNGEHDLELEIEQIRCEGPISAQDCDIVSSDKNTEISSPRYPEPYPTPISCSYTIRPNSETCQTLIRFLDFNVPESPNCLKGRLLIDGKSYCGPKTGWKISSNTTGDLNFEFSAGTGETGNFRVSVEQIPCVSNTSASQIAPPIAPFPPLCCNRIYNSPNFILASPGFLHITQPSNLNCVYQIAPASATTCKLKLIFLHFWLGQEDFYYGCTDGFIEIDGRRICGCKDGLVIDSYFNGVKTLWFNTRGVQSKGFLIEVQQEDCSYNFRGRSVPEETTRAPDTEVEVFTVNKTIEKVRSRFFVPSDDSRCYQWGLPHWLDKVRAILMSVPDQCPINNQPAPPIIPPPLSPSPPIIPPPNYPPPQIPSPPIIPPPSYPPPQFPSPPIIPPPSYPPPQFPRPPIIPPPSYPPPQFPSPPIIPPPPQFPSPPIIPPPQFPNRPVPPIIPPLAGCRVFSSLQGGLQSPGYPWSYPPNQKCCYR